MKVIIFGATHWEKEEEFLRETYNTGEILIEWYSRVFKYLPQSHKMFLTSGTSIDSKFNPLPIELIQTDFRKTIRHSNQNNYLKLAILTGIWKSILDYTDFDLLIHIQTNRFIGKNFINWIEEFMKREEQLMAFNLSSSLLEEDKQTEKLIDLGFMAMKKPAALIYAIAGLRQCCESNPFPITCEGEAFRLFQNSWWNPLPEMATMRQKDNLSNSINSQYEITDIEKFKTLPIIAAGQHVTGEFLNAWFEANKI